MIIKEFKLKNNINIIISNNFKRWNELYAIKTYNEVLGGCQLTSKIYYTLEHNLLSRF